jgi:signal transduction histidine kinase
LNFVEQVHNQTPSMFDEKPPLLTQANIESTAVSKQKEVIDMIIRHMESDRREIANSLHEQINQVLAAAKLMLPNPGSQHPLPHNHCKKLAAAKSGATGS